MTIRIGTSLTLTLITLAAVLSAPAHAAEPKIGDKVQIKLGETWVDATVTDVEGQRARAKVGAGIESWFGPTDYRAAGAAGAATAATPAGGAGKADGGKTAAAKPPAY